MIDTASLHERIADRAEDFVRELFGDAARHQAGRWRVGRHGSLAIGVRDGRLCFYDHEGGNGGDAVALWHRERGGTNGEALRAVAAWTGLVAGDFEPGTRPQTASRVQGAPVVIPPMSPSAFDAWVEGRRWLLSNRAAINDLAAWRGWPPLYVETLARAGIITAPRYYNERARIAYPVATPEPWPLGADYAPENAHRDRGRFVGWHARLRDRNDEARGWRYVPRRDPENVELAGSAVPLPLAHPGLPPLPLVLSGAGAFGQLWNADLLIVSEGEHDACTLPLALDWFDETLGLLRIPRGVAIVGAAGAGGGPAALLDAYRFAWPHEAAVLVLRDSDTAGNRWLAPHSFLDELRARCRRVVSLHFGTNPDDSRRDVNDFFRAGLLTRKIFNAALSHLGLSLAELERDTPPPAQTGEGAKFYATTHPTTKATG